MNIKNEIQNPNQISNNISVYPNPPSYYTKFENSSQAMKAPDFGIFSKISNFASLGIEYKINEYNFYNIELDPSLKLIDPKFIQEKQIPNINLFNENYEVIKNKISAMSITEQINIIKSEIFFLQKIYMDLTAKLNFNIKECEINNKLMKFAFQKIYFVISIIKKKQVIKFHVKFLFLDFC